MPDGFVPLGALLASRSLEALDAPPATPAPERATADGVPEPLSEAEAAFAAFRRFHAALADALEAALHDVLREIACDVLARELRLAPADIAAVAAGVLARFAAEEPLRVRVHPGDLASLPPLTTPVVPDSGLRRGDAILEVRNGTIDASLGARLEAVLGRR
jgi:flagellar assembly protein FliH